jgi:hypothetical protein
MDQSNETQLAPLQLRELRIEHNAHRLPPPGEAVVWVDIVAVGNERSNIDELSKRQRDEIMSELRKAQMKCWTWPAVTRVRELREGLVNGFARLRTAEGDIDGLKNQVQRAMIDGDAAQVMEARKHLENGQTAVTEAKEEVEMLTKALPGARATAEQAFRESIAKECRRLNDKFLKLRIPLQNELASAIQRLAMPILLADRALAVFDQGTLALRHGNKDLLAEFGALPTTQPYRLDGHRSFLRVDSGLSARHA